MATIWDVSTASGTQLRNTGEAIQALAEGLVGRDWMMQEAFLPAERLVGLRLEAEGLRARGLFRPAGIGHLAEQRPDVRGDELLWLEPSKAPLAARLVREELEALRLAVNAATYLGLDEFEGHYAVYPPGAGYALHLDRFREENLRVISLVLYLNDVWGPGDGGELRLHPEGGGTVTLSPRGGTLVCFLSERVPHEVLPARRMRQSIAGWFRRRA
jgi:SM-20-related protein